MSVTLTLTDKERSSLEGHLDNYVNAYEDHPEDMDIHLVSIARKLVKDDDEPTRRVLHVALEPSHALVTIHAASQDLHYWNRDGSTTSGWLDSWEEWGEARTESDLYESGDYAHVVVLLDPTKDEQEQSRKIAESMDARLDAHWNGAAITDEHDWSQNQTQVYEFRTTRCVNCNREIDNDNFDVDPCFDFPEYRGAPHFHTSL
jgi:hypothetical protein